MTGRRTYSYLGALALGLALLAATSLNGFSQGDGSGQGGGTGTGAGTGKDPRTIVVEPSGTGAEAPAATETPAEADSPEGAEADAAKDPLDEILKEAESPPDTGSDKAPAAAGAPAEAGSPEGAEAAETDAPESSTEVAIDPAASEPTPPAAVDIPVPTDPVAKAALDVLDKHCSRCHQDGKLVKKLKPSKNFGFVLKLDELAAKPQYVVPGNPDASKIVQYILNREMPYDYYYEADLSKQPPSEADVAALRAWITKLGESQAAACTDRKFVTPVDMVSSMATDLEHVQDTRVADTRYITLTHLYNACATEEEMKVYRQATVKLLNSLSRVSDVLKLESVDEYETIVRFNLKDLGWDAADWETILAVYPYPVRPDSQMYDLVSSSTLTPLPWVRGDWFAFAAAQPPLYDKLLKLPATFGELETQLGFNVLDNLSRFIAKRSGFQQSGVSQNNRLIERHTIPTGYLWTSYDFAGNRDKQSLFEFPLGPGEGEFNFDHDGGETIFSLPNGFQGYSLTTADGKKLDKGPTQIVRDLSRRDLTVTNGISCMGCHDQGMRKAKDQVREHILADRTFPKSVRDAVEALYPSYEEMDKILEGDAAIFRNAMVAAGLDPALKLNGIEMINALAKRYEDDVELALAAAEFGQTSDEFHESLGGAATGEAVRLGRRLDQGLVPRDTFEAEFKDLVDNVSDLELVDLSSLAGAAKVEVAKPVKTVADNRTFDLAITSDRSEYKVGELPVYTVTTAQDCFLTLINVDGKGIATVLYPNQFEKQNALKAGQEFKFPGESAPYQFRFADPGTETVTAICSLEDKPVDNIKLDTTREFTELGDYEAYLTRAITVESKKPIVAKKETPGDLLVRQSITMSVQ
jgi:hypothetical protein